MTAASRLLALFVLFALGTAVGAAPPDDRIPRQERDLGPYSVYGPGLTYRPMAYVGPLTTSVRVNTTISVPDRGEALAGGYSAHREGRNQFGTPILSRTPYAQPAFGNIGYGRDVLRQTTSVRVRIIDLREEEFRQTGVGRDPRSR